MIYCMIRDNFMILKLNGIDFAYENKIIIQKWSSALEKPCLCHLQGLNGSGKSTLLKCIAGILKPIKGQIDMGRHQSIGYCGHQLALHPQLTVYENLALSLEVMMKPLDTYLLEANLIDYKYVPVAQLSVGQQQKVALIRMMSSGASIWLMDEPFANLDHLSEAWLWQMIEKHLGHEGSVIFTAHQKQIDKVGMQRWQL